MVWAVIIGMGVLVFLNRYVFLEPRLPLRLSSNARQFLGFAVPGMLTAICGPIVFMPDKQLRMPRLPKLVRKRDIARCGCWQPWATPCWVGMIGSGR